MFPRKNLFAMLALACAAPTALADVTVPERLKNVDKLVYCSGLDGAPLAFFNQQQQPDGLIVDLGNEIAQRLGKRVEWRVTPFAGLIPAILARQCDLGMSQLFDKPERREVIDMVNYMNSSQTVTVPKGNPKGIHRLDDLSGRKVAVLNGSTIKNLLEAQNEKLAKAGKAPMLILPFNTDTDAFQALRIRQVDAYGTTVEFSAYYQQMAPGLFEDAVPAFAKILTGIGVRKDDRELGLAVQQVIQDMRTDGSYQALFRKWNVEGDALQPGEGNPLTMEGGA
ncbi:Cystine-binding periplasmic protein precursor [Pseudomonas sp. THAF187a]|uniref:ABC transporter substrate-binding protein n=1 Tax=unclassified Pseudomonas TaxID=196821 RepID=UPI001268391D|nr:MULTISPECIES: ABC transporter substrate-binding protein [unclassified Pseudomonas]QFT24453.1 Cystine-binding periplasmic protein precursor [Pseudomonas sp. THAF187a]QFT44640.1 Cystine-binding periplasmic protein precursor [Pseudomonas sp. THAF42]